MRPYPLWPPCPVVPCSRVNCSSCRIAAAISGGTTELLWSAVPTMNSFESGWEIFKPTVCAVQGPCIGYGTHPAAASLCLSIGLQT